MANFQLCTEAALRSSSRCVRSAEAVAAGKVGRLRARCRARRVLWGQEFACAWAGVPRSRACVLSGETLTPAKRTL